MQTMQKIKAVGADWTRTELDDPKTFIQQRAEQAYEALTPQLKDLADRAIAAMSKQYHSEQHSLSKGSFRFCFNIELPRELYSFGFRVTPEWRELAKAVSLMGSYVLANNGFEPYRAPRNPKIPYDLKTSVISTLDFRYDIMEWDVVLREQA
jgi:hypothetical protein